MFNAMKYIKALEAVGVQREQAEAQVQLVFDAMEGELVNKIEFGSFRQWMENRFDQSDASIDKKLVELEYRITTRHGFITISALTIAVAILTWIIKLH